MVDVVLRSLVSVGSAVFLTFVDASVLSIVSDVGVGVFDAVGLGVVVVLVTVVSIGLAVCVSVVVLRGVSVVVSVEVRPFVAD
ncbi:hypothetical protein BRC86_13390 [Halobacteriales archaeon QS_3_64_16]|nr:MAG: hypothetical protein BRC86_13390 [Halobacteriales archaeon QS_3_64_16]